MCYNIYRWRKCQPDTGAFLEFYFLFFSFLFLSFGNPGEGWLRRDFRFRVITWLNLRFRRGVRALSNACIMLWISYTALMNTAYDGWLVSWTLRDTLNKSGFRRKKSPDLWAFFCENNLKSVFHLYYTLISRRFSTLICKYAGATWKNGCHAGAWQPAIGSVSRVL